MHSSPYKDLRFLDHINCRRLFVSYIILDTKYVCNMTHEEDSRAAIN